MADDWLKIAGVALFALVSLAFIYYFLVLAQGEQLTPVTEVQVLKDLQAANSVFIISDLRGSEPLSRNGIMQCGVDLASSTALGSKNVSMFVIDGDKCETAEGAKSALYCDSIAKSGFTFLIKYGNSTSFYKNRIVVGMQDYTTPCSVSEKT